MFLGFRIIVYADKEGIPGVKPGVAAIVLLGSDLMQGLLCENIRMPTPNHRTELAIPTLLRLKQYVDNSNINILFIPKDN